MSAEPLYVPDGDGFVPTPLVTSPWSPDWSHGGPPAALLARAVERLDAEHPLRLARITVEILRPIPMVPLRVDTQVIRPGRRVRLVRATLTGPGGEELAIAHAWSVRVAGPLSIPGSDVPPLRLPDPDHLPEPVYRFAPWRHFPVDAQDLRVVAGELGGHGRAAMWFRLRGPLVAGEPPTPEQRVVVTADSANGLSRHAETTEMLFINVDLTVHLAREPAGEWVGLDAASHWSPSGRGLSDTVLHDAEGFLGRSNQTLFLDVVSPRGDGQPIM